MVAHAQTLGCFQIESARPTRTDRQVRPEQNFDDIIVDISPFRPGPVKSDMVVPSPDASGRAGPHRATCIPIWPRSSTRPAGGGLPRTDHRDHRRRHRLQPRQGGRGSAAPRRLRGPWSSPVLFALRPARATSARSPNASGTCWRPSRPSVSARRSAAAPALPTYQSAWLKWYWPAHFIAGILTHDPGMYLKGCWSRRPAGWGADPWDGRQRVRCQLPGRGAARRSAARRVHPATRAARRFGPGIRLSPADVKGIEASAVVVDRGRPALCVPIGISGRGRRCRYHGGEPDRGGRLRFAVRHRHHPAHRAVP